MNMCGEQNNILYTFSNSVSHIQKKKISNVLITLNQMLLLDKQSVNRV